MFQSAKQKRLSYIVFGLYLFLLAWLVLFKFATNLSGVPSMRSINIIPFYYDQETSSHFEEVLYNILVFIPLGVYIQIFKEDLKLSKKCVVVFLISFLFEVVQFVFALGASDITDIIGNTFGGIVGVFLCITIKRIAPKKYVSTINALGMFSEIIAIGLLVLLLIANG